MDPEHCLQWISWAIALGAGLSALGLDQSDQIHPRHNLLNTTQKTITFSALHGCALFIISEPELVAAHEARLFLRSQGCCLLNAVALPESPLLTMIAEIRW